MSAAGRGSGTLVTRASIAASAAIVTASTPSAATLLATSLLGTSAVRALLELASAAHLVVRAAGSRSAFLANERMIGNDRDFLTDEALNIAQETALFRVTKSNREARSASAGRAADAVNVGLGFVWQVVVDNQ